MDKTSTDQTKDVADEFNNPTTDRDVSHEYSVR